MNFAEGVNERKNLYIWKLKKICDVSVTYQKYNNRISRESPGLWLQIYC